MDKFLSIIIPAYNVENYIGETLSSLTADDSINDYLDIIVINDGSKDSTSDIAHQYENKFSNTVRVINKENGGHGSGINYGVANARGKYTKVIDGDDWVETAGLKKLVNYIIEKDDVVDLIINPYERVKTNGEKDTVLFLEAPIKKIVNIDFLFEHDIDYSIHSASFSTDILKKAIISRKIDEHISYDDMEYILYPLPFVNHVVFLKDVIYQYRVGLSEQSTSLANMQKNLWMHEMVIKSLREYLDNSSVDFTSEQEKYYLHRLYKIINTNCNVILSTKNISEGKKHLKEFVSTYQDIFDSGNITNRKVRIIRKTKYLLYEFISNHYRNELKKYKKKV